MRIIAIGDTHGYNTWEKIKAKETYDKFIFIGDYFDSFAVPSLEQQENFMKIAKWKEAEPDKVVLLIGNHDHHYFPDVGYSGTSGYQPGAAPSISHLLQTYRDLLQMAHSEGDFLFTHAGVGEPWLETNVGWDTSKPYATEWIANSINDMWKFKPLSFCFTGNRGDDYGDSMIQTPIWIRPLSLTKASHHLRDQGVIQVVGHTHQKQIFTDEKATIGGHYYFIDVLPYEYLIINNGKIEVGKLYGDNKEDVPKAV